MNHRHRAAVLLAGMILSASGCDNNADAPPPPPVVDQTPPPPPVPTTQELVDGPRTTLALKLIPFTLQAPQSWKVVAYDDREKPVTMVEGPIIGDEVRISLGLREAMSGEILRNYLNRLQKEDAELQKIGGSIKVTEDHQLRIIELRRPPAKSDLPPSEQSMEWRITILRPSGITHEQYVLQFIGLTVESYDKNKDFLTQILKSLQYDSSEPSPLPPRL